MKNEIQDIVQMWGWANPPEWVVAQAERCLMLRDAEMLKVIEHFTGESQDQLAEKVQHRPNNVPPLEYLTQRVSGLSAVKQQILATYNNTLFYDGLIDESMLVGAMMQSSVKDYCHTHRCAAFHHPESRAQIVLAFCDWSDLEKFDKAGRHEKMENPLVKALGDDADPMLVLITNVKLNEIFGRAEASAVEGSSQSGNRSTWAGAQAETDAQRVISKIFDEAIQLKASDITFWPEMDGTSYVVFRRHGRLIPSQSHPQISFQHAEEGLRFLLGKTKAQTDGSTLMSPADGNLRYRSSEKEVFMRHNYVPIHRAGMAHELIAGSIRIFTMENVDINLEELRLPQELIKDIRRVLKANKGTILVVAPVNEGKSTTVGGIIAEHVKMYGVRGRKRISVEMPVERYQDGLISLDVPEEKLLPKYIRALFRQDLDFGFIGEVRDSYTAAAFARVGTSGHIVASTGHADDSPGGIAMVLNYLRAAQHVSSVDQLVVHPSDFVSKIALVIAQRLVPELCGCKLQHKLSQEDVDDLRAHEAHELHTPSRVDQLVAASEAGNLWKKNEKGCSQCYRGVTGERPVAEWIPVGRALRSKLGDMVQRDFLDHSEIIKYRKSSLYQSAIDLVLAGDVDLNDVAGL
jgi:type II secretory ATPase GspE/PulE/Tfp pilus assembly ATPase PilB-like protein